MVMFASVVVPVKGPAADELTCHEKHVICFDVRQASSSSGLRKR
jgi:hypothetical protein